MTIINIMINLDTQGASLTPIRYACKTIEGNFIENRFTRNSS